MYVGDVEDGFDVLGFELFDEEFVVGGYGCFFFMFLGMEKVRESFLFVGVVFGLGGVGDICWVL